LFTPFETWIDAINSAADAAFDDCLSLSSANAMTAGLWAWGQDISPSQITGNQDNYNPSGLSTAVVLRLSTDASRNVTGIAGGQDGRLLILCNVGSNAIVLQHDVTSTAANRFYCPAGADYTLVANAAVLLIYDSTSSRWRVQDNAGAATQAEMETGTSTAVFVSPGRQHFHPGHPKGFAVWGVDGALDRGYNADAMTDTGAGDWTVNWTTDFSGVDYAAGADNEANGVSAHHTQILAKAVGSMRVVVLSAATPSEADTTTVSAWALGDFA
jgi:hypothetical protein